MNSTFARMTECSVIKISVFFSSDMHEWYKKKVISIVQHV